MRNSRYAIEVVHRSTAAVTCMTEARNWGEPKMPLVTNGKVQVQLRVELEYQKRGEKT